MLLDSRKLAFLGCYPVEDAFTFIVAGPSSGLALDRWHSLSEGPGFSSLLHVLRRDAGRPVKTNSSLQ
jgi:hypothetical protein